MGGGGAADRGARDGRGGGPERGGAERGGAGARTAAGRSGNGIAGRMSCSIGGGKSCVATAPTGGVGKDSNTCRSPNSSGSTVIGIGGRGGGVLLVDGSK